jgi:hypothetical protein
VTGTPCFPRLARVLLAANWERPLLRSTVRLFQSLAGSWRLGRMSASEKNSPFHCLGLFALHGRLSAAGTFLSPGGDHCLVSSLCAAESGGLLAYGADNFMTMALFYLMLSPLPDRYSWIAGWLKQRRRTHGSWAFGGACYRCTLCFVYFFGGLAKLLGSGWWNGSNLWRSLIRPPFNLLSPTYWFDSSTRCRSRNFNLPDRVGYQFSFGSRRPDSLVGLHFGNARRNRTDDGNVSVCSCYDCTESGRVRRRY